MHLISAKQSKAARALLEWLQEDLAKAADVSLSTVSSFENGFSPRRDKIIQIRKALENAGIEFTEGEGLKLRDDEAKIYRGFGSCDLFYNDLLRTTEKSGGEIYCIVKSQDMLMQACGITDYNDLGSLELLGDIAPVKCLISGTSPTPIHIPSFEFRTTSNYYADHTCSFGYGNKYAHIVQEGRSNFVFAVFRGAFTAQNYRSHFLSLWNNSSSIQEASGLQSYRPRVVART